MTTTTTPDPVALAQVIVAADEAYYAGDSSALSDAAYDQAKRDLADAVATNPTLRDQPTIARAIAHVGHNTSATFAEVRHDRPMLSLDNAFDLDELAAWATKAAHRAGDDTTFSLTPKVDGLSLSALYENGVLTRAATRGDGTVGENVTEQARTILNLPHTLTLDDPPARIEVRGEVYIAKDDFDALNTARVAEGKDAFANRRNAAAGSLRQKDPSVTARRRLRFQAFAIGGYDGDAITSDHQTLELLRTAGFEVSDLARTRVPAPEVPTAAAAIADARDTLNYDIDGVVVKVEDTTARDLLGFTSRAPNWAIALKPKAEQATTVLRDIELQVGRTGRVTPRAVLDPVEVGGVVVTYATLNNAAFIAAKDVRIGDTVIVQRAGDVIPEVVGPIVADRPPLGLAIFSFPKGCPVCGTALDRDESADARCVNDACASRLRSHLIYWASRKVADADGLGEGLIDRILEAGLVTHEGDLLHLTVADLAALDRVGDTLARKVVANLAGVVTRFTEEPVRVLTSLGIRMNGAGQAKRYIKRFKTVNGVLAATRAELETAEDIGPERARRMHEGLRTDRAVAVLKRYAEAGVDLDSTGAVHTVVTTSGQVTSGTPLDGLKLVLTGTLDRPRDAIKADLEALGATVSGSLSAKTDLLIAGEKAGSKAAKADKLGVRVIGQDELDELLAGQRP